MIKKISREEYVKLWESMKGRLRLTSSNIDPMLKHIKILNSEWDNEYDRLMHEHLNPPMSRYIRVIEVDGETIYEIGEE